MNRVEVYWNLHKRLFSVRKGGKVVEHAERVILTGASFDVQPSGRARVLESGRKNVHAFVRGERVDTAPVRGRFLGRVEYDPEAAGSFTVEHLGRSRPIVDAPIVVLTALSGHPAVLAWSAP